MSRLIGIPAWESKDNHFGVSLPYAKWIKKFGTMIMLPPSKEKIEGLSAIVLPGGPDISSFLYGEEPNYENTNPDKYKEFFFVHNLQMYIDAGVPIFGICLGMQQIAVRYGAKFIQDYPFPYSVERNKRDEKITVNFDYINSNLLPKMRELYPNNLRTKNNEYLVNSMHHQGVVSVPDGFVEIAKGHSIEAIIHKELPIAGVQWHPEEIDDIVANILFQSILNRNVKNQ